MQPSAAEVAETAGLGAASPNLGLFRKPTSFWKGRRNCAGLRLRVAVSGGIMNAQRRAMWMPALTWGGASVPARPVFGALASRNRGGAPAGRPESQPEEPNPVRLDDCCLCANFATQGAFRGALPKSLPVVPVRVGVPHYIGGFIHDPCTPCLVSHPRQLAAHRLRTSRPCGHRAGPGAAVLTVRWLT